MALLEVKNLTKNFGGLTAVGDVSMELNEGELVALIGPNGAGKSTLMNSIAGVLSIDEGDILLEGQSIKKASVDERSKDISRVFQDPRMGTATNLSIEENMAIAYRRGKKRSFFKKSITESERQVFNRLRQRHGVGRAFPLGLAVVQKALVVPAIGLHGIQRLLVHPVIAVLAAGKQQLSFGLHFIGHCSCPPSVIWWSCRSRSRKKISAFSRNASGVSSCTTHT